MLDYIAGGCEMNLMVAIDFTASNGAPSTRNSLHYRNSNSFNQYESAIYEVGRILAEYDSDQKFPMFGFGGSVHGKTSHCFPLTLDPAHIEVEGVDGMLDAYRTSLDLVSLSGPTNFSQVLTQTLNMVGASDCSGQNQSYTILLIVT